MEKQVRLVVGALAFAATSAWASDLTVAEAVWTSGVHNRQYVDQVRPGSVARELYFWIRLRGGPKALEALKQSGKLPIIHQWVHSTVLGEEALEVEPEQDDGKQLTAGSIEDLGGLSAMVNDSGAFRWRTWSHKESLRRGTWIVTVRFSDGEAVQCDNRPCRWSLVVR